MEALNIVIVGGAGGLGSATARLMAERGAAGIAIIDTSAELTDRIVADLNAAGCQAIGLVADVTHHGPALRLFNNAAEQLGAVHAMVNCAGWFPRKPILEITDDEWSTSFDVNVRCTHNMMAAAVEHMRGHGEGGRIVNISSVDAFKPHPKNAHYAAMKAAVTSLTKSFALEFAPDQILVNSVAPGGIATEAAKEAGWIDEHAAATPLGRAAEPLDIAEMIVFLASSRNRYTTGENVIVGGGYVMH
jgi:NAD(P)-dependent dehydrogenase (short-subunit alcohol dehydrogenase family)